MKRSAGSEGAGDWPRLIRLRGGSPSRGLFAGDDTDDGHILDPEERVDDASMGVILPVNPLDCDKRSTVEVVIECQESVPWTRPGISPLSWSKRL